MFILFYYFKARIRGKSIVYALSLDYDGGITACVACDGAEQSVAKAEHIILTSIKIQEDQKLYIIQKILQVNNLSDTFLSGFGFQSSGFMA